MTVLKLFDDKEYMKMADWDNAQLLLDSLPEPVLVQAGIWQIETPEFETELFLDGNRIVKFRCSCSKTKSRTALCSHLIATILKTGWVKQRNKPVKTAFEPLKYLPQKIGWKNVLDSLDTHEMYQFCSDILKGNPLAKQLLLAKFGNKLTGLDDENLQKLIFPNWSTLPPTHYKKGLPAIEFRTLMSSLKIYQQHLIEATQQEEWQSSWDIFKVILNQVQQATKFLSAPQSAHIIPLISKCIDIIEPLKSVRLSPTLSATIQQNIYFNSVLKYFIEHGLHTKLAYFLLDFSLSKSLDLEAIEWLNTIKTVSSLKYKSHLAVLEEIVITSFDKDGVLKFSDVIHQEVIDFYLKNQRIEDLMRYLEQKSAINSAFKPLLFEHKSKFFPKEVTDLAIELWDAHHSPIYVSFLKEYLTPKKYEKWHEKAVESIEKLDNLNTIKACFSLGTAKTAKEILLVLPDIELWMEFIHEPLLTFWLDDITALEQVWIQYLETHLGKKPIFMVLELLSKLNVEQQDFIEKFKLKVAKKFPERFSNLEKNTVPKTIFYHEN